MLLARVPDGRFISFFGDLHPSFFGNVVKAMGSAKQGYPGGEPRARERRRRDRPPMPARSSRRSTSSCAPPCIASIASRRTIVEVIVHAPLAARSSGPASSTACRTSSRLAAELDGTRLAMEGLALTGAWVDREKGLVSTIVLEMGGSSDLCALLKPGEPVILMGPTGTPTETPGGETVVLVGGGLGNAVLFSIGAAMRAAGSRVLYFAGYKKMHRPLQGRRDRGRRRRGGVVLRRGAGLRARARPQDQAFVGNIVAGDGRLRRAARLGRAADRACRTRDRIIAIGSDAHDGGGGAARATACSSRTSSRSHVAIGSINSPMQCMMKEICAQCLQPQVDPATGKTSYVFSCFNQDQPLDRVDFAGLRERLEQNSLQEKLTAQWIDRCLKRLGKRVAA